MTKKQETASESNKQTNNALVSPWQGTQTMLLLCCENVAYCWAKFSPNNKCTNKEELSYLLPSPMYLQMWVHLCVCVCVYSRQHIKVCFKFWCAWLTHTYIQPHTSDGLTHMCTDCTSSHSRVEQRGVARRDRVRAAQRCYCFYNRLWIDLELLLAFDVLALSCGCVCVCACFVVRAKSCYCICALNCTSFSCCCALSWNLL